MLWLENLRPRKAPSAPQGRRIYAVGDIHGRADLVGALLAQIDAERGASPPFEGRPIIVFIGDYVDRGLRSREVIDLLLALEGKGYEAIFLKGNHDAAMLDFLDRPETGPTWFALGGAETLFSYGVPAPAPGANASALRFVSRALRAAMPLDHLRFFSRLQLYVRLGDYLFVHAGIRPGESLERQSEADLLEIRDAFLKSRQRWPFVVVHGHTPVPKVERMRGRIALDTGAYATGRLSAVRLQGSDVAILST